MVEVSFLTTVYLNGQLYETLFNDWNTGNTALYTNRLIWILQVKFEKEIWQLFILWQLASTTTL